MSVRVLVCASGFSDIKFSIFQYVILICVCIQLSIIIFRCFFFYINLT